MLESANKKTRSVSFRIPEDLAEGLETEAEIKKVNTSALLAQILRHHIGYEGNAGRAGLVAFPRPLLIWLMNGYSEQQVIKIAENISKDIMTDIMSILEGEYNVESFLRVIESWAKTSQIPFRLERKGKLNTFVVQHDLSKNWSIYLGNLFKYVIEGLAEKRASIDTTNNTVRCRF